MSELPLSGAVLILVTFSLPGRSRVCPGTSIAME